MKVKLTPLNKALYFIFYLVSTLLYIGWLLLLSSCTLGEQPPNASIYTFEGKVLQYEGKQPIAGAMVVIARAIEYEQLTQQLLHPVADTVLTDNNGSYRLATENELENSNFYHISAFKDGLLAKQRLTAIQSISPTRMHFDDIHMGTYACLKIQITKPADIHEDSLFIGVLPNQRSMDLINPLSYRFYPLDHDTVLYHHYLYEDHQSIGVTQKMLNTTHSGFISESILLHPNDTVTWYN